MGKLVITHILPRRALRAQREAKKALLGVLCSAVKRNGVEKPAFEHVGIHQG